MQTLQTTLNTIYGVHVRSQLKKKHAFEYRRYPTSPSTPAKKKQKNMKHIVARVLYPRTVFLRNHRAELKMILFL